MAIMAIIDVAILVDAPRILQTIKPNNAAATGNYVQLPGDGQWYVYMFATWNDVRNLGLSELDVFANVGDTIRWRMATFSLNRTYQAFIKGFVFKDPKQDGISTPVMKQETVQVPQMDATGAVVLKSVDDVYWESTVQKSSPVTYHANFILCGCDCSGGGGGGGGGDTVCNNNCGGYTYDPFINMPKQYL